MAKLTVKGRKALPSNAFAVPAKAPGSGSYPIPDASHARNALSRVAANGSPAEKAEVRAAVHRKFPAIGTKGASSPSRSRSDTHSNPGRGVGGPPRAGGPSRQASSGASGLDRAMSSAADHLHPRSHHPHGSRNA